MSTWSRLGKITLGCALAIGMGAWAVGCRQGEGDRCQIDSDCASPLKCNLATQSCAAGNAGGIDALNLDTPIDTPPDAAPDAPDAM